MKIGELSRATGVSVRALRYYEQEGLIRPARSGNGHRYFCAKAVEVVQQIRGLIDCGLPTRLIRESGTHVIGAGYGAFAEYMLLLAAQVALVPAGWSDEQALGLILNWATALAALRPLGRLTTRETVLIHAAAGGVGQAAVRMAKHYGATVIATASPGKHETVRSLGADHVLDPNSDGLAAEVLAHTDGKGADLVLESVGGPAFAASLTATKRVTRSNSMSRIASRAISSGLVSRGSGTGAPARPFRIG